MAGNQDGHCTYCGLPVWWADTSVGTRLVTAGLDGTRWCYGPDGKRVGWTHQHALPGMAQYVVTAADGQVCHCLDRKVPHIHQVTDLTPGAAELARDEDGLPCRYCRPAHGTIRQLLACRCVARCGADGCTGAEVPA